MTATKTAYVRKPIRYGVTYDGNDLYFPVGSLLDAATNRYGRWEHLTEKPLPKSEALEVAERWAVLLPKVPR